MSYVTSCDIVWHRVTSHDFTWRHWQHVTSWDCMPWQFTASYGLCVSIHHGKRTLGRRNCTTRVAGGASMLRRLHVCIFFVWVQKFILNFLILHVYWNFKIAYKDYCNTMSWWVCLNIPRQKFFSLSVQLLQQFLIFVNTFDVQSFCAIEINVT